MPLATVALGVKYRARKNVNLKKLNSNMKKYSQLMGKEKTKLYLYFDYNYVK